MAKKQVIKGSKARPRLRTTVTLSHIYAQVIDDIEGKTLAAASTLDKEFGKKKLSSNVESAKKIGTMLAERAKKVGVETVVFDRGPKRYHGKVKALADAARQAGLKF